KRIAPLQIGSQLLINPTKIIQKIGFCSSCVALGIAHPGRLPQRSKDIAFATPSIVEFLLGALCWPHLAINKVLARITLGRYRTHLINIEDGTALRWAFSQQFDGPLFSANCG